MCAIMTLNSKLEKTPYLSARRAMMRRVEEAYNRRVKWNPKKKGENPGAKYREKIQKDILKYREIVREENT